MRRLCAMALMVSIMFIGFGCGPSQPHGQDHGKMNPAQDRQGAAKNEYRANVAGTPDLIDGKERDNRQPQPLTLAELRYKYRSNFLLNGTSSKNEVALTFDDAPDEKFTPQVLDVLKKYQVKATFFVMGNRAEAHPDLIRRMLDEGHVIGNHSYSHPNFPKLGDLAFQNEVLKTQQIIRQLTGHTPAFIRPPYGNVSEDQIKWLVSQKLKVVNWNVDSLDWKGLTGEQVSANVLTHTGRGSIVLQHAAGGQGEDLTGTVEALPIIIETLRKQGITLVTVPELLDMPGYLES